MLVLVFANLHLCLHSSITVESELLLYISQVSGLQQFPLMTDISDPHSYEHYWTSSLIRPEKIQAHRSWFKSRTGLNFFRSYFNYSFISVHSCEDRLFPFLPCSAHIWFWHISNHYSKMFNINLLHFGWGRQVDAHVRDTNTAAMK